MKSFIINVFDKKHTDKIVEILQEIRLMIQQYLAGLIAEMACVAFLNSIGLLLVGAPYAVLLGVIGAILNLIPYIGGIIAMFLTGLITLTNTGDSSKMLLALGVYLVVQFIDNNFLVPRMVGSRVKLNALISLVAVLIGGALCGIGGMFLSLPFMAMLKVIFDRIDELKPWGNLFGDEENAGWDLTIKPRGARKKKTAA